jgi:hypothetical protein
LVSHPNITNYIVGYIDADQLAHKLYDNDSSPMLQQILRAFGPNVFTVTDNNSTSSKLQLDRKALGNVVFADPEQMSVSWKNIFNGLVHTFTPLTSREKKTFSIVSFYFNLGSRRDCVATIETETGRAATQLETAA